MNTGTPWPSAAEAKARVLEMQTKLHRWAGEDEDRRFDDVANLVWDPAFLTLAWERVRGNVGSRSAGVNGETVRDVEAWRGAEALLGELRADLRAGAFRPLPVRERMIPSPAEGCAGSASQPSATGFAKRRLSLCWSPYSRRTSSRAPMDFGPSGARRT